jgi:hypothetical protein
MFQAEPPAAVAAAPAPSPADKPAQVVVVSRDAHSDVLASRDTPLPLIKGRKTEDALLRQTLFITVTLTVVRPGTEAAAAAGERTLRWTYEPYLQRQLCFTSMTGQFSCAVAEVEELTEKVDGEAPLPSAPLQATVDPAAPVEAAAAPVAPVVPASSLEADAARTAVVAALRARAEALFDDDRRLELDPILKAAGVTVRRLSVSARPVRR